MTPPADFGVEVVKEGGSVVVTVSGDVDYTHYTELEAVVDHEIARAGEPVDLVVDLTDVPYCDSCGMRVLLGTARRVAAAGGRFALRGVQGQPSRALKLTGLDRVLGA